VQSQRLASVTKRKAIENKINAFSGSPKARVTHKFQDVPWEHRELESFCVRMQSQRSRFRQTCLLSRTRARVAQRWIQVWIRMCCSCNEDKSLATTELSHPLIDVQAENFAWHWAVARSAGINATGLRSELDSRGNEEGAVGLAGWRQQQHAPPQHFPSQQPQPQQQWEFGIPLWLLAIVSTAQPLPIRNGEHTPASGVLKASTTTMTKRDAMRNRVISSIIRCVCGQSSTIPTKSEALEKG